MLVSMHIRNVALIEDLTIDFSPGMNVLSGETGAGKSIIIDSLNLVLGGRADRGLIRDRCDKASVEALFDIRDSAATQELLSKEQIEAEDGMMTIQREITLSERNICRVCGSIVTLAFLRTLTEALVDVHGQHEHQSLLDCKKHMHFLDSFGNDEFMQRKNEVAKAWESWHESSLKFAALRKENAVREEKQNYLKTKIEELEKAHLEPREVERLVAERDRFAGSEKIHRIASEAYRSFQSEAGGSLLERLKAVMQSTKQLANISQEYGSLNERATSVFYEAEEISFDLRNLLENETFDENRAEAVRDRLDLIRRLERKYAMPADELAVTYENMKDEFHHLETLGERLVKAEAEFKTRLREYRQSAAALTAARKELAAGFEDAMEKQLADLGMLQTRFKCVFREVENPKKIIPTPEGDDEVTFYIAPNPGEPLKPLDKTASGGELSRLMLAMKTAGAEHDDIPCMIFDEIDTGISGNTAGIVAQKMASIARYHQVLCITHLAQIAAMADVQFLVRKQVQDGRTFTRVHPLDDEERVQEIARLIGVTEQDQVSGLSHAATILSGAEKWKAARLPKPAMTPLPENQ